MPHASLKIVGGVCVNETPALNQAGLASTNLVRFKPDPQGLSLPEKLGGWAKFWANKVTNGPVRCLWAYQDTEAEKWIIYGTSNSGTAQLAAIECFTNLTSGLTTASSASNYFHDITPQYQSDSVPIIAVTTLGSSIVTITDPTISGVTQYDIVYFTTPVAVGGLVLSGMYAVTALSGDQYEITATNVLGQPLGATYATMGSAQTVTGVTYNSGPPATLAFAYTGGYTFKVGESFVVNGCSPTTANGTYIVTAQSSGHVTGVTTLGSYSYSSGGTITNYGTAPIFQTTSGSNAITVQIPNHGYLQGDTFYVLNQTVVNGITLFGDYQVLSVIDSANFTIDGPSSATSTGYQLQNAITIVGGSGDGSHVTLTLGNSTYVNPSITVTGGSSTTTHVTLTWSTPSYTFVVGDTILVSGASPSAWNGSYAVTSSTSTSVTYALSGSALSWVSGGVIANALFNIGAPVLVSGATPTGWNGWYILTGVTATTITYANATAAGSWVNGGSVSDNGGDEDFIYSVGFGPPALGTGFGVGGFGVGGFGTGVATTPLSGTDVSAATWDLNNWGDITLALAVQNYPIMYLSANVPFQPIYYWDPTANQQIAQAITAGPQASSGMFVAMPQRQIVAWGSTFSGVIDPLLIRWCDVNNYNTWVAQVTNQAGSFRLPSGSIIMGGLQTPQQGLIWTDIELWSMQYISQPYVYSFNKIGQGCGLIARRACCAMNGIVYWMSNEQFFTISANGVQPLVCPIWDTVYQQLDLANVSKITCQANSLFQEVTWSYPVKGGTGEVSAYVQYNAILNVWSYGYNATNTIARSAWLDVSVLGQPIGYDPVTQYIYQHEISPDADGQAMTPTFTTGWFAISEGDLKTYVDEWWPDFKYEYFNGTVSANVQLTFGVVDFPWATPYTYGPYTVTNQTTWINPRFRGRLCSITVSSSDVGTWWRIGNNRYRVAPDGKY